jgi:hypothetical protein
LVFAVVFAKALEQYFYHLPNRRRRGNSGIIVLRRNQPTGLTRPKTRE